MAPAQMAGKRAVKITTEGMSRRGIAYKRLRANGITVTALHTHMLTEQPRLFFMHFWAVGDPHSVGAGIKAVLSHIAVK